MEKIKNFRDLTIWKLGIGIVEDIYKKTEVFPKDELYGSTAKMRKCAVSIPTNIAEGFVRKHSKEYRQFLCIAQGFCAVLETQIEIPLRLKYFTKSDSEELLGKMNESNYTNDNKSY